ncbi:MAG: aminopeptidase P family protein [Gemmatimonadetes bacterium]|nr:aminopeptidase P family protein [Gemmatimonadota bacterium]
MRHRRESPSPLISCLRGVVPVAILASLLGSAPARAQVPTEVRAFDYDFTRENALSRQIDLDAPDPETLRDTFRERRRRVMQAMPGGAMLVFSVEWVQPRRLEFQVQHSDNHDFIYLTGLEGLQSVESALLLLPGEDADGSPRNWEVLYSSQSDLAQLSRITGIEDVRPFEALEEDLSVAMTDYRDWRITQIRRWPLPAALAREWGEREKVLYLNYPRFFRLGMPEPERLAVFDRFRRFSPDVQLRDAADVLDRVRMLQDGFALASLRRAVEITGEGIVEAFRAVQPGHTELEVMEMMDFVYRYRGAYLGFPTSVRRYPPEGPAARESIPEGFIQYQARSGADRIQSEDMVHTDTGAAFNHFSADVQRNMPADGTFDDEQRRLYQIALDVQTAVIEAVRPGVTWWELHDLAESMLAEAGGYDEYWTYGIGHFIGMEVHDEGDYEVPLQPGMALSIEQGVAPPNGARVAFEDDVIVTEDGFEWVSRSIPITVDEVEAMLRVPSSLTSFAEKGR